MSQNDHWTVASRPEAEVQPGNFSMTSEETTSPADGDFLVEVRWLVVTPPLRMALTSGGISRKPIPIGAKMRSTGLGRVVESRNPNYAVDDLVVGELGWQQFAISKGIGMRKVRPRPDLPESTLLHVLGAGGATAYFGMCEYARPRIGDTLVVSAAAGNVGSLVCQLGRLQGCRVVGIAGSADKCRWLTEELRCVEAINYKTDSVPERLEQACPRGIDIYFDNVGGEILDTCLGLIAQGARVVLCGGISRYNETGPIPGPVNYFNLIYRRARMEGFIVVDYMQRFPEAIEALSAHLANGELHSRETVLEGFERLPEALIGLFHGNNLGKQLVKVT